jgi:hypothetical protein
LTRDNSCISFECCAEIALACETCLFGNLGDAFDLVEQGCTAQPQLNAQKLLEEYWLIMDQIRECGT